MNTAIQPDLNQQQVSAPTIQVKNAEQAKKEPPKIIGKMIDKMEEMFIPAIKKTASTTEEVTLPEGTTITLPDGKEFETNVESKLRKVKGGE